MHYQMPLSNKREINLPLSTKTDSNGLFFTSSTATAQPAGGSH